MDKLELAQGNDAMFVQVRYSVKKLVNKFDRRSPESSMAQNGGKPIVKVKGSGQIIGALISLPSHAARLHLKPFLLARLGRIRKAEFGLRLPGMADGIKTGNGERILYGRQPTGLYRMGESFTISIKMRGMTP